jgi:hypothetical protein
MAGTAGRIDDEIEYCSEELSRCWGPSRLDHDDLVELVQSYLSEIRETCKALGIDVDY